MKDSDTEEHPAQENRPSPIRLSEDWWAVIIGLGVAALVWVGATTGAFTCVPWPLFGLLK